MKLEDDVKSDFIAYEKFEPYMIQVLVNNEFEPAPPEHLIAAFKTLDPMKTGRVRKDIIEGLLPTKGIALRPSEYEQFV